jgi:hypothetical protein
LEALVLKQPFPLRLRQSGNVRKAGPDQLLTLAALEHTPVSDERHTLAVKPLRHLRNLGRYSRHIWGIPSTDLHGDRRTLFVTQQPNDDLFLPRFAVPVIAKRREGVALALEVTARDVIEKERRLAVATPSRA